MQSRKDIRLSLSEAHPWSQWSVSIEPDRFRQSAAAVDAETKVASNLHFGCRIVEMLAEANACDSVRVSSETARAAEIIPR